MRHYCWDGEHRLVGFSETRHGNEITSFTYDYDCFGRRVRKHNVLTGESRLFFWQDDRLIAECDEKLACPGGHPSTFGPEPHTDATNCRSYVYEPNGNSFRPLAMLGGRGKNTKVFYYINDHLGTPQELVSPSGEIVWSAVYHAYGQQAFTLANHIPQPLRFQGQYHDEESGLSYNRYRYYDVSALRYLSPDPIGLAGGVNAYAYVPSPLSWVDPLGLTSCKLAEAMEEAGISRPANSQAHHIVPETAQSAGPARDVLNKHGIDINGADNGVFLPNRHNTDGLPGIEHNGRHPDDHIDDINRRIGEADKIGGKVHILKELSSMRNILLSARRDEKWSNVLK
ncbi:hypothetical protein EYZ01_10700 [Hafnia alvei]|uniref:RHS repeat-associated core domain-containing protein n=1 Tax=Hafnia alvei TaxID=569 RepID=UPI001034C0A2|nr:RHS repeat-associated core domain-containing protein [Hafnia alvei]TBL39465.1 hypothetical protein EYZ01_10700 [Hafnia alvei]